MQFIKPLVGDKMAKMQHRDPGRVPFILSGLLSALAFPPVSLWFLAWVSLVPLLISVRSLSFGSAFRRAWWAGLVFNACLLYWIALNSGTSLVIAFASFFGLLLVLPLYWAFFGSLWAFLYRQWGHWAALSLPAVWVGLEIIKNAPEVGFPWLELGLTQVNLPAVTQLAELGGIRLVSVWVVTANVLVYFYLQKRTRASYILGVFLLGSVIWGAWRLHHLPDPGPPVTAAVIQGNIDPAVKWRQSPDSSLAVYENLTRQAAEQADLDLVVWPETAAPVYLGHQTRYQRRLRQLAKKLDVAILTGASHYEFRSDKSDDYDRYNSAFFFPASGDAVQRYDKIRLVPFGERVPFQSWFPRLGELNFGQAEFTPGKRYTVFRLGNGIGISAQICFESIFGSQTRRFILNGSRVLFNLTNDGWYGRSSGPYQHAALVRFQCIATRTPLLRAANTGISLAADRTGGVIKKLPLGQRGFFIVTIPSAGEEATFFVRYGEIIPRLLALIALLLLLVTFFKRPVRKWRS
jgi:apolipoprotein N-acyltransferase